MSSRSRSPEPEPVELPSELLELSRHVESRPESFLTGDADIQAAALNATKWLFDKAVSSESTANLYINELLKSIEVPRGPITRSAAAKLLQEPQAATEPLQLQKTPIEALHLNGMGPDQVWEQLELRTKNICAVLESVIGGELGDNDDDDDGNSEALDDGDEDLPDGFDRMDVDEEEADFDTENGEDDDGEGEDDEESDEDVEEEISEHVVKLRDDENLPVWTGTRHPVLDDGFFSIDRFNRETELLEAHSKSRGRLSEEDDDDEEDDEEGDDIDLYAPLNGMEVDNHDHDHGQSGSEDDSDEGESGPSVAAVFGTEGVDRVMFDDFFRPPYRFPGTPAPRGEMLDRGAARGKRRDQGWKSKSDLSVRFDESVRVKKIKPRGKGRSLNETLGPLGGIPFMSTGPGGFGGFAPRQSVLDPSGPGEASGAGGEVEDEDESDYSGSMDDGSDDDALQGKSWDEDEEEGESGEDVDEDVEENTEGQEAIERVKDDILSEPLPDEAFPEELSSHERRMAAISQEIAILEDENIAEKHWTMAGEANAKHRPENSLLETDLEFEHGSKPVPIITEEVAKSLEDMIKGRILEGRFDDVVRQSEVDAKAFLPSSIVELQDTQSRKSLAQIYEDDYNAASGEVRPDSRDAKLAAEHAELDTMWNDICYKLDALSNAHFTPKQPKSVISTIANVASTTLENALPTSVSTATLLAPEEVFAHDPRAAKSKNEMTPSEKKSLHTKVKHAKKRKKEVLGGAVVKFAESGHKSASANAAAGLLRDAQKRPKNAKEAKDLALESLVKSGKGVTVVGKPHMAKNKSGKKSEPKDAVHLKL
ncbi:hypothetical protein FRB99_007369 [Tulasnella sp. 403]|nr:hypothetical protein FRB99_007369 [Tulasnella sp. 403]